MSDKMKKIEIEIYSFNELSEEAKVKAIQSIRNTGMCGEFVWDDTKEDAKQIGLKIISLDSQRDNQGEFMEDAQTTAKKILNEHGEQCETYNTASLFLNEIEAIGKEYPSDTDEDKYSYETKCEEAEEEFLKSLLEDYRIMLEKNIEYSESDEAVIEMIEANEYEFLSNGERYF